MDRQYGRCRVKCRVAKRKGFGPRLHHWPPGPRSLRNHQPGRLHSNDELSIARLIRPNPCAYVYNAGCLSQLSTEGSGDSWIGAAVVAVVRADRVVKDLHGSAPGGYCCGLAGAASRGASLDAPM